MEYSNNKLPSFIKNTLPKQNGSEFNNIDEKKLDQLYLLIKKKILHLSLSKIYSDLCNLANSGDLSPSEAD